MSHNEMNDLIADVFTFLSQYELTDGELARVLSSCAAAAVNSACDPELKEAEELSP